MAVKRKIKRGKADLLLFDLKVMYGLLKIGFGEAFYHHNKKIWISETPFQDATLVPIENVIVNANTLEFDSYYQKRDTHFIITSVYEGSDGLMNFIKFLNETPFVISEEFSNDIIIQMEEQKFSIKINSTKSSDWVTIHCVESFGNYFVIVYPEPSKRYKIQSCSLINNILYVKCEGFDLYDENRDASARPGYEYEWKLDMQPELLDVVSHLIQAGLQNR